MKWAGWGLWAAHGCRVSWLDQAREANSEDENWRIVRVLAQLKKGNTALLMSQRFRCASLSIIADIRMDARNAEEVQFQLK